MTDFQSGIIQTQHFPLQLLAKIECHLYKHLGCFISQGSNAVFLKIEFPRGRKEIVI